MMMSLWWWWACGDDEFVMMMMMSFGWYELVMILCSWLWWWWACDDDEIVMMMSLWWWWWDSDDELMRISSLWWWACDEDDDEIESDCDFTKIYVLLSRPTTEWCVLVNCVQYLLLHLWDCITVQHLHWVRLLTKLFHILHINCLK